MKILGYKNIARSIMISTILLILFNTLLISLFYYQNQLKEYEENLTTLRYQYINQQKDILKKDVTQIIKMIEFKYSKDRIEKNKNEIINWIKKIEFDKSKSDYIMVYDLLKKEGGDDFARLIVNPNRLDIQGTLISSNYTDIKGFKFREKFLEGINSSGEAFVQYHYKKINNKPGKKISYFYYYAPLNWVVAKGVYIEDIQQDIDKQKKLLELRLKKQIKQNLFFFLFFSIIAIVIAYIIGKKTQFTIESKDKQVKNTTKALATFNRRLDSKVKREVEKNKKQQAMLMQRSKFIALGEMISLIAHQWRQPISELNAIILNIKMHHKLDKLDKQTMEQKTKDVENILEFMSNTIDNFRTFFKPTKKKELFYFVDSFKRIKALSSAVLKEHKIELDMDIDESLKIQSYQNEFEQVILNIITNAKDALLHDKVTSPRIEINIYKEVQIYVKICDNAKGIDATIIAKIFDPYFTTKEETEGTGIGLYMSKMIIEQNMDGKLEVQSSENGTCFIISF